MTKKDLRQSTDFSCLVDSIQSVHQQLQAQASKSVNAALTIRNWLIGYYVVEFEQSGSDRASYGEELIKTLAVELKKLDVIRSDARELRRYRQFYLSYPQIREALSPEFSKLLGSSSGNDSVKKRESATPISGQALMSSLSFTHMAELLRCEPMEKRAFYENQCIKGSWSVRELKRQIASLLYERSQLSTDQQKLGELANSDAEQHSPALTIRDPYVFEFLGLKPTEVMAESDLENRLLDKLQEFLLELGHGFCFEARQRRILIGDTYNFVDLVFYHRILKCHVLVDLKLEAFSHENIGQLNTYVTWFNKNVRLETDNPPVGLLLCAEKDHALAEYALAGMDNELFVSKYQLELPSKDQLEQELESERLRLSQD